MDYDYHDAQRDDADAEFADWCDANDRDPEDPDSRSEWLEDASLAADPYRHYGVSRWDFM